MMNPLLFRPEEDALGGLLAGMTPQEAGNLAGPGLSAAGGLLSGLAAAAPGSLGRAWQGSDIRRMAQDALDKASYYAGPHLSERAAAVASALPAMTPRFGTEDAQAAGEAFKEGKVAKGAGLMGLGVAGGLLDAIPGESAAKGILKGLTKAAHYTPDLSMALAPIKGFHGSPHDFDRFDINKIGTGEGAQAYGHGLYLAENENVAKIYRDMLATQQKPLTYEGHPFDQIPGGMEQGLIGKLHAVFPRFSNPDEMITRKAQQLAQATTAGNADEANYLRQQLDFMNSVRDKVQAPKGHMYEVGIHADPERFLDWDKPFREQSKTARDAINDIWVKAGGSLEGRTLPPFVSSEARSTGEPLYASMATALSGEPGASKAMLDAGIPGIKYLDQGSRGAGTGSRNYVVFSDNILEILRKYGLAGLGAGLGGTMAMQPGLFPLPQQQ